MLKKRMAAAVLALCMMLSLSITRAGAVSLDRAVEATRILGILPRDTNLDSKATRAQLAVMLASASSYKDSVGTGGGSSLFRDVKRDHWASEYIKLAVQQGWMLGYVDGTFRPEQNVTLEEACASLLTLLGYDASSLAGSYPYAQLTKAATVGLRDDLSAGQGQTLTLRDCAVLFYNLLVSQNSSGTIYGTVLGYTVSNGQIDYTALVTSDTKGPYVAQRDGVVTVPFGTENAIVYRDGLLSALSSIREYDVYYYNANMETIWVYSKRISGTLTAVAPNTTAPTSVTIAGTTYNLGTSDAVFKCSNQGSFPVGSLVTLLLDKDGSVADIVSVSEAEGIYYGLDSVYSS